MPGDVRYGSYADIDFQQNKGLPRRPHDQTGRTRCNLGTLTFPIGVVSILEIEKHRRRV